MFQVLATYELCTCHDWGETLTQYSIHEMLGKPFTWCPWCGRNLLKLSPTTPPCEIRVSKEE